MRLLRKTRDSTHLHVAIQQMVDSGIAPQPFLTRGDYGVLLEEAQKIASSDKLGPKETSNFVKYFSEFDPRPNVLVAWAQRVFMDFSSSSFGEMIDALRVKHFAV